MGAREASWEQEGVRGANWMVATQNLAPQVVGTPKDTPQSPLFPTSTWSIGSEGSKLGARGGTLGPTEVVAIPKLGPTGGGHPKTYPWEPLEAFSSLGSSVRLRGLALLAPPPLTAPWLPLTPEPPWTLVPSLGHRKPSEPLEAFGSLGSSIRLRSLAPSHPPISLSLPFAPPHPLSLPGPRKPFWGLRKPWEPSEAFGSLGSSVRFGGLASLAPPTITPSPLSFPLPPEPPWAPGTFLGPQEALGAFRSLWRALGLSQTQGLCSPCSPTPHSPFLPNSPLPPEPPWTPETFLGPQKTLGALDQHQKPWEPWKHSEPQGVRGGKRDEGERGGR